MKAHTRYITSDGRVVPGVTSVVALLAKPALIKWANNLGLRGIDVSKYVDATAQAGMLAHQIILSYYGAKTPDYAHYSQHVIDKAENAALSFFEWAKSHTISNVYYIETPFVHDQIGYGGTPDMIATVDDALSLIDIKTGLGPYQEHYIQLSAYSYLVSPHFQRQPDKHFLIYVPRSEDESFTVVEIANHDIDKYFECFRHLLDVYKLLREGVT